LHPVANRDLLLVRQKGADTLHPPELVLSLQHAQSLPNRRPADAKHLGQLLFRREHRFVGKNAMLDLLAQPLSDHRIKRPMLRLDLKPLVHGAPPRSESVTRFTRSQLWLQFRTNHPEIPATTSRALVRTQCTLARGTEARRRHRFVQLVRTQCILARPHAHARARTPTQDRKSTRLNSSHVKISYAVFCLKK